MIFVSTLLVWSVYDANLIKVDLLIRQKHGQTLSSKWIHTFILYIGITLYVSHVQ